MIVSPTLSQLNGKIIFSLQKRRCLASSRRGNSIISRWGAGAGLCSASRHLIKSLPQQRIDESTGTSCALVPPERKSVKFSLELRLRKRTGSFLVWGKRSVAATCPYIISRWSYGFQVWVWRARVWLATVTCPHAATRRPRSCWWSPAGWPRPRPGPRCRAPAAPGQ